MIRRHELVERFDPSGGPGGQHANRPTPGWSCHSTSVRAPRSLPEVKRRALGRLADRFTDGVVTITSADTRSQWRNRRIARTRLVDLLADAITAPPPPRRPTRPTTASRRRRLDQKRLRAEVKRLRRRPEAE